MVTKSAKCVIIFFTVNFGGMILEYKVNSGIWGSMFGVPDIVADNFLKLASGEQIKVLLYLLRNSGKMCSAQEISMNTGVPVQQAADAVIFWQQANILTQQDIPAVQPQSIMTPPPVPQPSPAPVPQPSPVPVTQQKVQTEPAVNTAPPKPEHKRQNLDPSQIAGIMRDSVDIAELFKITESMIGSLNHTFQNLLIWMYDYLGLKKEVIIVLISHCKSIDKTNPSYIEKVAADWAENEINDLDRAQTEVQRIAVTHDFTGRIMRMFEMTRRPTGKQAEFIEQWRNDGYSDELIHFAYEKTIEQINKLSFDYINKILVSWRDSGYTTVQNVRDAESDYKKRKNAPKKAGTDPDIEKYKVLINKF